MSRDLASQFDERLRLQTKAGICEYLHISRAQYDAWEAQGKLPGPLPGTQLFDVRAHDQAIDEWSGLSSPPQKLSPLERWERARERL